MSYLHHKRRFQEDKSGDGYRGEAGRGVGDVSGASVK